MADSKGFFKIDDCNELRDLYKFGYKFDWTKKSSPNSITVVYADFGDIAGAVEFERQPENLLNYMFLIEAADNYKGKGVAGKLLAYVAKDSLDHDFEGFVLFEAKTVLVEYYQKKYGARPIYDGSRKLYFDTEASKNLIRKYLEEDIDND